MIFTVAVIGRPNVGKSTFFNRLTGTQHAIVDDTPGVTRDRREGDGRISDLKFKLVDTAGLDDADDSTLEGRMRLQTEKALTDADVIVFMIDGRAGVMPLDEHFASWVRKQHTPVLLLVNKCEGRASEAGLLESYSLGLGEPIPFSAAHGIGLDDLYDALLPYQGEQPQGIEQQQELLEVVTENISEEDMEQLESLNDKQLADKAYDEAFASQPLQLAIVGRPNVGKSTMVNKLLGEDRLLTGPEAGITRDAISITWDFEGRPIKLIDTAGMRRKSKIREKLEGMSVGDSLRSIRYAHIVVLVLDADAVLDKQDLTIARHVINEGRALIICINKWDQAKDRNASLRRLKDKLQTSLPQARGITVITCSAKTGKGLDRLLPAVLKTYDIWNARISTADLNRWLEFMTSAHPTPAVGGRRVRIRYMTQAKTRPPTFVLFSSRAEQLPESYLRYLVNGLREDFGLDGIPIRLHARKSKNPYA